jgi:hypothetical protein
MAMVFTDAKEPGNPITSANDSSLSHGCDREEVLALRAVRFRDRLQRSFLGGRLPRSARTEKTVQYQALVESLTRLLGCCCQSGKNNY